MLRIDECFSSDLRTRCLNGQWYGITGMVFLNGVEKAVWKSLVPQDTA